MLITYERVLILINCNSLYILVANISATTKAEHEKLRNTKTVEINYSSHASSTKPALRLAEMRKAIISSPNEKRRKMRERERERG